MSFAAPTFLIGLLAVPLLAAAAIWARRRTARYAVRLPSAPTLAAVLPRTPRWQRWLPSVLLCLALAGLAIALARPQATVAIPVERASVMLVVDASGSMRADDVEPTRLEAARRAARSFLKDVPESLKVGLVSYSDAVSGMIPPTEDRQAVRADIDALAADSGTATGPAVDAARQALADQAKEGGKKPPSAIVLLSDGRPTVGRDPVPVAQQSGDEGIPIYTVALGTAGGAIIGPAGTQIPVPPDPETLKRMAEVSRGQAFSAEDADALDAVYERLGSQIGTRDEKREITAGFAGAGLLLLVAAIAGAVRWRGRLP